MKNNERYFKVLKENSGGLKGYHGNIYPMTGFSENKIYLKVDGLYGETGFLISEVEEVLEHSIQMNGITTPASEANNVTTSRTFESGSKRDNDDHKPLVNHLAPYLRLRYGYHLRKGANHYGKGNWKLGQPKETAIESLNRHLAYYELIFNIKLILENEQKAGIAVDHFFKLTNDTKK